jgi:hypothetical protein
MTTLRKLLSLTTLVVLATSSGLSAVAPTVYAEERPSPTADGPVDCTKNPDDKRCADKK